MFLDSWGKVQIQGQWGRGRGVGGVMRKVREEEASGLRIKQKRFQLVSLSLRRPRLPPVLWLPEIPWTRLDLLHQTEERRGEVGPSQTSRHSSDAFTCIWTAETADMNASLSAASCILSIRTVFRQRWLTRKCRSEEHAATITTACANWTLDRWYSGFSSPSSADVLQFDEEKTQ